MFDWHYWGTGHGKGPHDGVGACLKQCIRTEQLQANGAKLHNASDVTNFLRIAMNVSHVAYSRAKLEVVKKFIEIKVGEVDRQHLFNCKPEKKETFVSLSVAHMSFSVVPEPMHYCLILTYVAQK